MDKFRDYEGLFILDDDLEENKRKELIDFIKSIIEKNGGSIVGVEEIGKRKLITLINKKTNGYYFIVYFRVFPVIVEKMEKSYLIKEGILRNLITLKEKGFDEKNLSKITLTQE